MKKVLAWAQPGSQRSASSASKMEDTGSCRKGLQLLLSHIMSNQMISGTDIDAPSSRLVAKRLEFPWVHYPDVVALTRHCERSEATSRLAHNYNDLDAVCPCMRNMQQIATSLLRLAMTTKRNSSGIQPVCINCG